MKETLLQCKIRVNNTSKNGFTLIELLVVITLIGILTSFAIINIQSIRQKTRDAQRKKDLLTIQTALESYRADLGNYPGSLILTTNLPIANADGSVVYMRKTPSDPTNTSPYQYIYTLSGFSYFMYACLENVNDANKDSNTNPGCTAGSAPASFTVTSP